MRPRPTISMPQGVRDILPEEAARIGAAEDRILKVFERYGYRRVITPLLEYVDVLSLGMGTELKDRVLKFIDPSTGQVVAIRPDITPQIARMVASRMKDAELPLRLCYYENALRYQAPREGKSREVLQVGAEHVSETATPEADAEMVVMAIDALLSIGLEDFKIDIGDVGFVRTILDHLDVTGPEKGLIKEAVAIKDTSGLASILDSSAGKVTDSERRLLMDLTTFYGEEEVLEKASEAVTDPGARAKIENLKKVTDIIAEKGYMDRVTLDLGEVRGFDYYTGMIFEGFASGVGKPILSGGRYDNLLEKYGYPRAATGFAFDVENIVAALPA